jgi:hypothetical protein
LADEPDDSVVIWPAKRYRDFPKGTRMHVLIGQVQIKPGRESETLSMIDGYGVPMLQGMAGFNGAYWARTLHGDLVQHSFWLFDTEENARAAEATFNQLRSMPDAPAAYLSVDVCEVVGYA